MTLIIILIELILIWPACFQFNKWLKRKGYKIEKNYSNTIIIIISILIPVSYYQYDEKILEPQIRKTSFNSLIWKNNESERYTMVNDIITTKKFIGKNKNYIVKILGSKFEKGPCENCIGYSTYDPDIGFGIDHDVLAIEFDTNNIVIETRTDLW